MLGEVRPATRKSPPLFGITCIHCGAEMTDEFVPELIQRWNTRVTATASIDKEVMEGRLTKSDAMWRRGCGSTSVNPYSQGRMSRTS